MSLSGASGFSTEYVYLSRSQVRQVDADAMEQLKMPGVLLMENAARGVCDVLVSQLGAGQVVIVCGSGNNGGDGLALFRQLSANHRSALLLIVDDGRELSADAKSNAMFLQNAGICTDRIPAEQIVQTLKSLNHDDWVIDALLGTGLKGSTRAPYDEIIDAINKSSAKVLAVDLPSGLDCDTGEPLGRCVQADCTVTFVARKQGFRLAKSEAYTGTVHVTHIGLPAQWLDRWLDRCQAEPSQAPQTNEVRPD